MMENIKSAPGRISGKYIFSEQGFVFIDSKNCPLYYGGTTVGYREKDVRDATEEEISLFQEAKNQTS